MLHFKFWQQITAFRRRYLLTPSEVADACAEAAAQEGAESFRLKLVLCETKSALESQQYDYAQLERRYQRQIVFAGREINGLRRALKRRGTMHAR